MEWGCTLANLIDTADLFSCSNCPIVKYNCCGNTEADYDELNYRLRLEIQRLEALRKKVLDKMES